MFHGYDFNKDLEEIEKRFAEKRKREKAIKPRPRPMCFSAALDRSAGWRKRIFQPWIAAIIVLILLCILSTAVCINSFNIPGA